MAKITTVIQTKIAEILIIGQGSRMAMVISKTITTATAEAMVKITHKIRVVLSRTVAVNDAQLTKQFDLFWETKRPRGTAGTRTTTINTRTSYLYHQQPLRFRLSEDK